MHDEGDELIFTLFPELRKGDNMQVVVYVILLVCYALIGQGKRLTDAVVICATFVEEIPSWECHAHDTLVERILQINLVEITVAHLQDTLSFGNYPIHEPNFVDVGQLPKSLDNVIRDDSVFHIFNIWDNLP